jgi:hypothetical protein
MQREVQAIKEMFPVRGKANESIAFGEIVSGERFPEGSPFPVTTVKVACMVMEDEAGT